MGVSYDSYSWPTFRLKDMVDPVSSDEIASDRRLMEAAPELLEYVIELEAELATLHRTMTIDTADTADGKQNSACLRMFGLKVLTRAWVPEDEIWISNYQVQIALASLLNSFVNPNDGVALPPTTTEEAGHDR
jgi:hypothetical protein